MLPQWGDRQAFLPRNLDYVGSFDLQSRGFRSVSPLAASLVMPDDEDTAAISNLPQLSQATFYHALRAASVTVSARERDCPAGRIAHAFERLNLRAQDGLVEVTGQLVLHTDDNASIDASYSGVARFFHPLTSFSTLGAAKSEERGQVFISIGFDTADQRYAWMGDRQCMAFGIMKLTPGPGNLGITAESTYDIYTGS